MLVARLEAHVGVGEELLGGDVPGPGGLAQEGEAPRGVGVSLGVVGGRRLCSARNELPLRGRMPWGRFPASVSGRCRLALRRTQYLDDWMPVMGAPFGPLFELECGPWQ